MRILALAIVVLVGCGDDAHPAADAAIDGATDAAIDAAIDAPGPPVATVTVTPSLPPMIVGTTAAMQAELRDASGAVLTGRAVTWTSSDPARLAVDASGVVTAIAAGGPIDVTATSEGQHGAIAQTVVAGIVTGIADIHGFLDKCPTSDPAYATIRQDFRLLSDGTPVAATLPCTEPYSAMPIAQLTDELYVLQALRIAYYLSPGTQGKLPWTTLAFYPWMHAHVAGINLKAAPGQLYCCDSIGGQLYFAMSRQDDFSRGFKRDWPGLSSTVAFIAHEIRHADPGAPGHVNGCPAFPAPTDPLGCDQTYSLANLGSYGIQYWLYAAWATGTLHVGVRCAPPATATAYLADAVQQAASYLDRFVTNAPPAVTSRLTYGGACP